VETLNLFLVM